MPSKAIGKRPRRRRLVQAATDAYLDWRDQCHAVSDAYRCWADGREDDAALAWEAYEDALDREQQAAVLYAEQVKHLADLDTPDGELGARLAVSGEVLR
jgi:hypothetical protein